MDTIWTYKVFSTLTLLIEVSIKYRLASMNERFSKLIDMGYY